MTTTVTIKTGMTIEELYNALGDGETRYISDNLYVEAQGVRIIGIDAPRAEDGQYWVRAYWMRQSGLTEPETKIFVK